MRPRIGITTSTLDRGPEGPIQISAATHLAYAHCIYNAGGLPLLLPNLPEMDDAAATLAHLDGLLLSGGGDIDPAYWGEAPHPALGAIDVARDRYETALVTEALRRDLPLLGVCRGVQVMAVATGGDLWQDIPDQFPTAIMHRQSGLRHETSHEVLLQAGTPLAHALGWAESANGQHFVLPVNSFHHQAPRNCGTLFTVVASSSDGLIEGLAAPDATLALGVQWHPEEMAKHSPRQAALFLALVAAARGERRMTPSLPG